jgi:hypothetical protein
LIQARRTVMHLASGIPQPIYQDHLMKLPLIVLSLASASIAHSQTLYLDTNGNTSGAGTTTPASWDAAIWTTSPSGNTATSSWVAGSTASFSAGSGAVATRTINLGSTDVQIAGIVANNEAVIIGTGGGALTNSGNLSISGNQAVTIAANINVGTNTLTYSGGQTLTLSGSNTIGTLRNANSGTLKANSTGAFGSGTVENQGYLNFNNQNVTAQVITGYVTSQYVTNAQNYTGTVISGGATLNGYSGPNPALNGVFTKANHVISSDVALKYATTGFIRLESQNASLQLDSFTRTTFELGPIINNSGHIYTASGALNTLHVAGDLTLKSGTYSPFAGGANQTASSVIDFNLSGTNFSKVVVDGAATLGGTLNVSGSVFEPTTSFTYNLITASSFSGSFDTINLPTLTEGYAWDTSLLNTTGSISITAVPEPATYAALAGLAMLAVATIRRRRA